MASRAKKIEQAEPVPSASDDAQKEGPTAPADDKPRNVDSTGRVRDYAAEHRRRKQTAALGLASSGSRGGGPKTKSSKTEAVRDALTQTFVESGAALSFVAPTAGIYWTMMAQRRADNLVAAATMYPWLMPYLEKIGPTTVLLSIGTDVLAFALAIGVDVGRVDPYSPISQTMRVAQAFELAHKDDDVTKETPANGTDKAATRSAPDFLRPPAVEATG